MLEEFKVGSKLCFLRFYVDRIFERNRLLLLDVVYCDCHFFLRVFRTSWCSSLGLPVSGTYMHLFHADYVAASEQSPIETPTWISFLRNIAFPYLCPENEKKLFLLLDVLSRDSQVLLRIAGHRDTVVQVSLFLGKLHASSFWPEYVVASQESPIETLTPDFLLAQYCIPSGIPKLFPTVRCWVVIAKSFFELQDTVTQLSRSPYLWYITCICFTSESVAAS